MSAESPVPPVPDTAAECCGGTEAHCETPQQHIAAHVLDGCPKPIGWREVVDTFHAESTAWEIVRPQFTLRGRTWGTGRPLYLLNGMGGNADQLALLIYLLRDLYRCVVLEYPGTLGDRVRFSRIRLDDLADGVVAAADFHHDEQFSLFGTSFGSLVTLQTLARFSDRIDKAVIQGGFAYRHLSFAERSLARLGTWLPGSLRLMPGRRLVQKANHKHWFPLSDPTRWEWFLENSGNVPLRALAHRGCLIGETDLRTSLPEIQTPVMLLHCEGDGLVSQGCLDALATGLPNAHVEWFHSAGHIPFVTHPHRLGKLIRQFLEGEIPAPSANAPETMTSINNPTPIAEGTPA